MMENFMLSFVVVVGVDFLCWKRSSEVRDTVDWKKELVVVRVSEEGSKK